jgi:hypothetical protein
LDSGDASSVQKLVENSSKHGFNRAVPGPTTGALPKLAIWEKRLSPAWIKPCPDDGLTVKK